MLELISFRNGAAVLLPYHLEAPARGVLKVGGRSCELRHRQLSSAGEAEELIERLRTTAGAPGALMLLPEAAGAEGREVICAFQARRGAELRAVLRLVPLTLEQAALLGDGLLVALAALHRRGVAQERLDAERLLLGPDGRLRVAEPGLWAPLGTHPPGRDLERAARLLERVLGSVTGAARRDGSALSQLRSVAQVLAAPGEGAAARPALSAWRSALPLDPHQRRRVRGQLGALGACLPQALPAASPVPVPAAALEGAMPPVAATTPGDAPQGVGARPLAAVPVRPPRVAPPPPAAPAGGGRVGLGRTRALAALGAAAVLVSAGVLAAELGGHPASPSRIPHPKVSTPAPAGSTPPPARPSPPATPLPTAAPPGEIPLLGPPSAPPVQQVALTASCSPGGGSCQFNVTARLGSHPLDSVRWELDEVNRCTGAVATVARGVVSAPAFYTYVEAQPTVPVPAGGAVAMIALAGAGGLAASPPLSLGPAPASCPG